MSSLCSGVSEDTFQAGEVCTQVWSGPGDMCLGGGKRTARWRAREQGGATD